MSEGLCGEHIGAQSPLCDCESVLSQPLHPKQHSATFDRGTRKAPPTPCQGLARHMVLKSQCALYHTLNWQYTVRIQRESFVALPLWPASCHCHLPPPPPPPLPPHPLTTSCPSSSSAFAGASRPPSSVRPPSHTKCPPIHPSPTPTGPGSYDRLPRSSSLSSDSYEVRATLFRSC